MFSKFRFTIFILLAIASPSVHAARFPFLTPLIDKCRWLLGKSQTPPMDPALATLHAQGFDMSARQGAKNMILEEARTFAADPVRYSHNPNNASDSFRRGMIQDFIQSMNEVYANEKGMDVSKLDTTTQDYKAWVKAAVMEQIDSQGRGLIQVLRAQVEARFGWDEYYHAWMQIGLEKTATAGSSPLRFGATDGFGYLPTKDPNRILVAGSSIQFKDPANMLKGHFGDDVKFDNLDVLQEQRREGIIGYPLYFTAEIDANSVHAQPRITAKKDKPAAKAIPEITPSPKLAEPIKTLAGLKNIALDPQAKKLLDALRDKQFNKTREQSFFGNPFVEDFIPQIEQIVTKGVASFRSLESRTPEYIWGEGYDITAFEVVHKDDTKSYILAYRQMTGPFDVMVGGTDLRPVNNVAFVATGEGKFLATLVQKQSGKSNQMGPSAVGMEAVDQGFTAIFNKKPDAVFAEGN